MARGTPSALIRTTALICSALLLRGDVAWAQQAAPPQPGTVDQSAKPLAPDQLDSLVAPIALYPDPLLAQVLAASTYPLEIVQLQQWLTKHKDLKEKALADAVQKENWDPSIQGMAALPDAVKLLADNIKWTSELGNAFLAQQADVMDAVQRMRMKAEGSGKLKSNEQMKVETKVVENKSVVVIEQANPQVIYVPSYDPVVVYGAPPVYPYPPVYYPPPSAGYYAAGMAISFGVGIAMGAMWGGGWGYGCGWGGGHNNVYINNNNNFNRNTNVNRANVGNGNRSSQWQHNPQHRGGAPYGDRATASRYGGTARGESLSARQSNARGDRNVGADRGAANDRNGGANRGDGNAGGNRGDGNVGANRGDGNAGANRGDGNVGGNRGDGNVGGNRGDGNAGANRGDGNVGGNRGNGNAGANRGDGNVGGNRGGTNPDRVGNRQVSPSTRDSGAFGGAGRTSGSAARANSTRGASSYGGRSGGGRGGGRRR